MIAYTLIALAGLAILFLAYDVRRLRRHINNIERRHFTHYHGTRVDGSPIVRHNYRPRSRVNERNQP